MDEPGYPGVKEKPMLVYRTGDKIPDPDPRYPSEVHLKVLEGLANRADAGYGPGEGGSEVVLLEPGDLGDLARDFNVVPGVSPLECVEYALVGPGEPVMPRWLTLFAVANDDCCHAVHMPEELLRSALGPERWTSFSRGIEI